MSPDKDSRHHDEDEDNLDKLGLEPTPGGLAHWVCEQYVGDDRFESVEVREPGVLEEEAARVRFNVTDETHFFVAVLADDAIVRVGLASADKELIDAIEAEVEDQGGTLTDLVADALESDDDLEHEVEHFHDDMDYICADLQYVSDEDLASDLLRDEVLYYVEGFLAAFYGDIVEEDED
jgi:hypothetical protein